MLPLVVNTGTDTFELVRLVALSIGLISVLVFLFTAAGSHLPRKGTIWHHEPATATGVDAAEKGDTKRLLLEKVSYDLQKRAILHKRWLMIGHDSQWIRPGDYRTFTVAEIPFVVIRGEDGKLRAFHNVCRHRAYTVVRKPAGRTLRLFCRYHGWQYDSAGHLLKAPFFSTTTTTTTTTTEGGPEGGPEVGLDRRTNSLFSIHLRIDSGRFVFVNFATNLADAFPWSDISPSRLRMLDFSVAEEWEMEVDSDWRLASLLPWFLDPAKLSAMSWPRRCLAYLLDVQSRTRFQYVDDASFICTVADKYYLLVSALPMDNKRTVIKTTMIPQQQYQQQFQQQQQQQQKQQEEDSGNHSNNDNGGGGRPRQEDRKVFQDRVNTEVRAATETLKRHRTTDTNLDFRQSAIRERLDKFNRHVWHHKTLEKAAGKRINVAARGVTMTTTLGDGGTGTGRRGSVFDDAEGEREVCNALDAPDMDSNMVSMCSVLGGSTGELEW